jgi:hypothetical protein
MLNAPEATMFMKIQGVNGKGRVNQGRDQNSGIENNIVSRLCQRTADP